MFIKKIEEMNRRKNTLFNYRYPQNYGKSNRKYLKRKFQLHFLFFK